jgi:hypothetical protein
MAIVRYTIKGWTHQHWEDEIEIEDEALEGLSSSERDELIEEIVQDAVANIVWWGWELVGEEL